MAKASKSNRAEKPVGTLTIVLVVVTSIHKDRSQKKITIEMCSMILVTYLRVVLSQYDKPPITGHRLFLFSTKPPLCLSIGTDCGLCASTSVALGTVHHVVK